MLSIQQIKTLKSLHQKKFRRLEKKILLEGYRLIDQAIIEKTIIEKIYITNKSKSSINGIKLFDKINENNIPFDIIPEKNIKQISDSFNDQGVIAVSPIPKYEKYSTVPKKSIYLDGISDPGNMGTILRTAAWFGIKSIFLSPNCVDPFNSKVVRSAMGAHFYFTELRFVLNDDLLLNLSKEKIEILGTDVKGKSINNLNSISKYGWCLILGNESHGLSESTKKYITTTITIPGYTKIESLNVSVSGGILLNTLTSDIVTN